LEMARPPSPITFCVFSNTSSFTAAISGYIIFKRSRCFSSDRAEAPGSASKSLVATLVAMPPSITIESRRISAQGRRESTMENFSGKSRKIASWI
jgi:hypothetical protein